jgi:hypothetical protein
MAIRAAGLLSAALGLGFGGVMAISLRRLHRGQELPMTPFGFRAVAGGPFDALPRPAFIALGWTLLATCLLDLLAGRWLLQGRRRGARLALLTSPLGFVLALGFALPFLLVGVPLRGVLLFVGRRGLRA